MLKRTLSASSCANAAIIACALLSTNSLWAIQPAETTIYSFNGSQSAPSADGASPLSGLTVALDGSLFGSTEFGGTSGAGTVFRLIPPGPGHSTWTETVLHNFGGPPNDGANPFLGGVTIGFDGAVYGFTENGGLYNDGIAFKLTPPGRGQTSWTETILYNFGASPTDAVDPSGRPVLGLDGTVYGTTVEGGTTGKGTVFKLVPPSRLQSQWVEVVLYNFGTSANDGLSPQGGVVFGWDLALYGTTPYGGTGGYGTVFKLTPSGFGQTWTESVLYSFGGPPTDGANPQSFVTLDLRGALYSTTANGGTSNNGTVFKLSPPTHSGGTWTENVLYSFKGYPTDGQNPYAGVIFGLNGALYGAAIAGGTSDFGTVFELVPSRNGQTWNENTLHNFTASGSDGAFPYGTPVFDWDGALYGTTLGAGNGASGGGTAYRVSQFF